VPKAEVDSEYAQFVPNWQVKIHFAQLIAVGMLREICSIRTLLQSYTLAFATSVRLATPFLSWMPTQCVNPNLELSSEKFIQLADCPSTALSQNLAT